MKKFLFIIIILVAGFVYFDRAEIQPEIVDVVKEVEHEKLN